ncbi:MAG: pyruvate dehydrogenase [Candidatus Thermofonsia Clade 3 bacterium]|uniref:Pyruvate dehydrogenase E1 component n=1 Tax=Candidatus Thermofonsia Clade 3 bacterium TaxID=2364212 RepID=A0A2M8QBH0_9CHLR|nr:MAG: pyruvate dehydrogenase [Candidatus Thermofonsia Clade 3 bacterium]
MTIAREIPTTDATDPIDTADTIATTVSIPILQNIERRLLWLSTLMIHHANNVRPNPDKTKVGGHQASAASSVSILTALYFHFLKPTDRVLVKPHAAPAFHAAMYLMGVLPRSYLTRLREFGGIQSYPSRTKDVSPVDFSGGSMGLGPVAPTFAALVQQYAEAHFGHTTANRFIAISGDAELDEGNIWEALIEEELQRLPNTIWIVDLNRQSLDRITPGVRAAKLKKLFADCEWRVLEAKYGHDLQAVFACPGGEALRQCIDDMSNEEYQHLIRSDGATVREALARRPYGQDILRCLRDVSDAQLPTLLGNLGGHDLRLLIDQLREAERTTDRPSVIFAYTIKGYGLPIYGDPANHAALLSAERINELRASLGLTEATQWDGFDPDSPEGRLCAERGQFLRLKERARDIPPTPVRAADVPDELNATAMPIVSTQEAFGRAMMRLADVPKVGARIVTSSADVSVSTNLGGWINKVGTFTLREATDYEAGRARILNWQLGRAGQHIEMGIAEMNLFSLIGQMGMAHELMGQLLFPIGTVYDPFVCRGLDAIIYGLYSGAKFIFVATPSGVTLAAEGGAHQSSVTPSLGIELPELDYYEPTFAIEVEWALCEALKQCCDRQQGRSSYLRLSTKPIEQALLEPVMARLGKDELRRQFLAGGYVVHRSPAPHDPQSALHIVTTGVMLPEALEAAHYLESEGASVNLINLTSPRRAYDDWHAAQQRGDDAHHLAMLIPADARRAPILTVHDAAPHALAWVGSVFGQKTRALGVNKFGQSGYRADLYRYFHIDAESIIRHGFALVDESLRS